MDNKLEILYRKNIHKCFIHDNYNHKINYNKLNYNIYNSPNKYTEELLLFADNLTYIPFDRFYYEIKRICLELSDFILNMLPQEIYFIVPENTLKSGLWVTLLVYHNLKDIFEIHDNIKIHLINHVNNIIYANSDILCIQCDDASYSGKQLASFIPEKIKNKTKC
jgi:hypothetical protein